MTLLNERLDLPDEGTVLLRGDYMGRKIQVFIFDKEHGPAHIHVTITSTPSSTPPKHRRYAIVSEDGQHLLASYPQGVDEAYRFVKFSSIAEIQPLKGVKQTANAQKVTESEEDAIIKLCEPHADALAAAWREIHKEKDYADFFIPLNAVDGVKFGAVAKQPKHPDTKAPPPPTIHKVESIAPIALNTAKSRSL